MFTVCSGFVIQVTEWKYFIPVTRYESLKNKVQFVPTCPVLTGPVAFYNSEPVTCQFNFIHTP